MVPDPRPPIVHASVHCPDPATCPGPHDGEEMREADAFDLSCEGWKKLADDPFVDTGAARYFFDAGQRYRQSGDPRSPLEKD